MIISLTNKNLIKKNRQSESRGGFLIGGINHGHILAHEENQGKSAKAFYFVSQRHGQISYSPRHGGKEIHNGRDKEHCLKSPCYTSASARTV